MAGAVTRSALGLSYNAKDEYRRDTLLLVYGTDVLILVEVGEPSLWYSHESGPRNDDSRRQELDEVEEWRDMAYIRMVAQKQQA